MLLDARGAIRPRAASVVSVIWLFLGASWVAMGLLMAFMSALFLPLVPEGAGGNFVYLWVWFVVVLALGATGLSGALGLLKLQASARARLEWVNWLAVVLLLAFTGFWLHGLLAESFYYSAGELQLHMALYGLLTTGLTLIPFVWMAKALRRKDVRWACE